MVKKALSFSFVRYVIVGVVSFAADYGLLLLGYYTFGIGLATATTLGFIAGFTVNFFSNKFWAFSDTNHSMRHSALQLVLYGTLVVFNLAFTNVFVLLANMAVVGPEISKILVSLFITLWNYILFKKVIFPKKKDKNSPVNPLSQ